LIAANSSFRQFALQRLQLRRNLSHHIQTWSVWRIIITHSKLCFGFSTCLDFRFIDNTRVALYLCRY